MTSGPWHFWFAWYPVETRFHGWTWLTTVYRHRRYGRPPHTDDRWWKYDAITEDDY